MNMIYLLILVSLLQYTYFTIKVGQGRGKYGVKAPAVTGNESWERLYRVQMNSQEQLLIFIPSIYFCAAYLSGTVAQALGVLFIVFRFVYARSYVKDPASRSIGFAVSGVANIALLVGGIVGVMMAIFSA